MATSLNLNSSLKFTDPSLRIFHRQGEAACFTLQEQLDEGFLSLIEAASKIDTFTEKVRSMVKTYQQEKHLISPRRLHAQHAEFLAEYQGYKVTDLKAVILFENIEKTIDFIQPVHRSKSDEKSLRENMPNYYAELKQYEAIFTKYISQLKNTQARLSPLKYKLNAAINSKALISALEKFRRVAESQGTYPANSPRFYEEKKMSAPAQASSRRKSASPLYDNTKPSWKTLPLSLITNPQPTDGLLNLSSEELLPPAARKGHRSSWDSTSARREGLNSSREIIRLSPPQKRAALQPLIREVTRNSHREALLPLSGSGGRAFIGLSSSSSPRCAALNAPSVVSHLDRKRDGRDIPSGPERNQRFHVLHNSLRSRKTYENVDAPPYSGSHY